MQGGNQEQNAKAATDAKLFEAIFESIPQLYVQCIALLHYNTQCNEINNFALYSSMAVSTLSITYSIAGKFLFIIDREGSWKASASAALYFFSDAVTRALAVAMVYGAIGGYAMIGLAAAYVLFDLLIRCCVEDHSAREDHTDTGYIVRMLFSFFTAMPLSNGYSDRVQLFAESSLFALLLMVIASAKNYDNMYGQRVLCLLDDFLFLFFCGLRTSTRHALHGGHDRVTGEAQCFSAIHLSSGRTP